jgi:hypothetical protein
MRQNPVIQQLESDENLKTVGGALYVENLKNSSLSKKQIEFIDSKIEYNLVICTKNNSDIFCHYD